MNFKDGAEVQPDEHVKLTATPAGVHQLEIANAVLEDQGNYKAQATNPSGSITTSAPVTVVGKAKA